MQAVVPKEKKRVIYTKTRLPLYIGDYLKCYINPEVVKDIKSWLMKFECIDYFYKYKRLTEREDMVSTRILDKLQIDKDMYDEWTKKIKEPDFVIILSRLFAVMHTSKNDVATKKKAFVCLICLLLFKLKDVLIVGKFKRDDEIIERSDYFDIMFSSLYNKDKFCGSFFRLFTQIQDIFNKKNTTYAINILDSNITKIGGIKWGKFQCFGVSIVDSYVELLKSSFYKFGYARNAAWKFEKLFWIAIYKETDNKSCNMRFLPKDLIVVILKFVYPLVYTFYKVRK